jgi:hypothetical protein
VSQYAATTFIVAFSAGHSDITRFRPRSPVATGNHLDRAKRKKIQSEYDRNEPKHVARIKYTVYSSCILTVFKTFFVAIEGNAMVNIK